MCWKFVSTRSYCEINFNLCWRSSHCAKVTVSWSCGHNAITKSFISVPEYDTLYLADGGLINNCFIYLRHFFFSFISFFCVIGDKSKSCSVLDCRCHSTDNPHRVALCGECDHRLHHFPVSEKVSCLEL